jgi:hypothetical protein
MLTRDLSTGGPYGHVPGAAPPYHARQNDPADQADAGSPGERPDMSRVSGTDVDPVANAAGPVGVRSWDGTDLGYQGRDITNPGSGRPYNEAPGMFARLQQEAAMGQ